MGKRSPDTPKQSQKRGKKPAPRHSNCRLETGSGRTRMVRNGVAVLSTDELRFNTGRTGRDGTDFFLHIRYDDIKSLVLDAQAGSLTIATAEQEGLVYFIGRYATEWKKMIEERPQRLDELGVKPKSRIALVAIDDDELTQQLAARVPAFAKNGSDAGDGLDLLFVAAEHRADLAQLPALARRVRQPGGVIWVVYRTAARALPEHEIVAAGRAAGLVDAASVELSPTHTALKLTRI